MLRRMAGNAIRNILVFSLRVGISFLLTPFLIHALGRDSYGVWILASSFWIGGVFSILDLGIQTAVAKFVAAHDARRESREMAEAINAAFSSYLFLGVLACLGLHYIRLYWLTSLFQIPSAHIVGAKVLLGILAWQLLFEFPNMAFSGALEGRQRYDLLRYLDAGQAAGFAGLAWAVVRQWPSVIVLGWCWFGLSVTRVVATYILTRRVCPEWKLSASIHPATLKRIFAYSSQVFGMRANALVYNNMDKLIIGMLLTSTLLADYDVVYRLYGFAVLCLTFVSQLVVPASSALDAAGEEARLQRLKIWGTKTTIAICAPVTVVTMVLAEPILEYWIGPSFVGNARNVRLFLSYLTLWGLVPVGVNILVGTGRIIGILRVQIPTTLLNFVLSLMLARPLGIAGVILGTVVGNLIALAFYLRMFFGSSRLAWRELFSRIILRTYPWVLLTAGVLWCAVVIHSPRSFFETASFWWTGVLLFWVFYFLWGIDPEERYALNAMAGGFLGRAPLVGALFLSK